MRAEDDPRPPASGTQDAHLVETRVASECVFDGKLLHVRRDDVRLPGGMLATREYIVHPGAVLVVPLLADGRVVVERQFRYPLNTVLVEFPAGKREADETALQTARRELLEEAGYTAQRWTWLGIMHPVCSYSTESIEAFLAEDLTEVGAQPDEGELIDIVAMPYDELLAAAERGEVTDMKTLATLFQLERRGIGARRQRAQHLLISGRVQGVGFRDTMVDVARAHGVAGWVRNRSDGRVEACIQGPDAKVDALLAWTRRGPPLARVERVETSDAVVDPGLAAFERRR